MHSRLAVVALSTLLAGSGASRVSGATADRAPAGGAVSATSDAAVNAARLAGHGEVRLGWAALADGQKAEPGDVTHLEVRLLTELGRYREADSLLARVVTGDDARASFLYYLQRARLNDEAGRFDDALRFLDAIDETGIDHDLAAYADVLAARVLVESGDVAGAEARLARLRTEGTPAALRAEVDRQRLSVYRALDRPADALAASADAIRSAPDARARRSVLEERYRLAWECGRRHDALRAAARLFGDSGNSPEAESCALDLVARNATRAVPTSTLLGCADVLMVRGRTGDLRRTLRILDRRHLTGRSGEALRLAWGEYHYRTGDCSRAIALARPSYSDPALRRRSMLVMARSLRKLGRIEEAAGVYEHFVLAYPNDALAAEALYAASSLYDDAGREAASSRVLDELRRSYPSTFHGWAAAMERARRLSRGGHGEQAIAIYDQWLTRSQRTDEAALFYLARTMDATRGAGAGDMVLDELRSLDPYSFYLSPDCSAVARGPVAGASGTVASSGGGTLAEWLRSADAEREQAYERVLSATGGSKCDDAEAAAAIDRGIWFLKAGFRDWAEHELDVARRRCTGSAQQAMELARVYDEFAMPWRSVRLYERVRSILPRQGRREHADDFRYLTCPLPYPAQVLDSAARNGVPPHLVYGMIREESRFEADAVSRTGAVGLMQLMPGTAKRIASQIDLDLDPDLDALGDPDVNVALGVWYAGDLLRAGKGSVEWMLAAYNAGPRAADRWLAPGASGAEAIDGTDSIDYRETRGYVKRVVESANVYHALYFSATDTGAGPR